jgi:hypothetical protein
MQFAIGVTVLKCSFVKHSHGPLGVKAKIWRPCPKMGQGWPWKMRGRVESLAPLPPFSPTPSTLVFPLPSPPLLSPHGQGGKGGKKGGGDLGSGRGLQWVHGSGPCTTPSFGCPPKFLEKIHYFSISF